MENHFILSPLGRELMKMYHSSADLSVLFKVLVKVGTCDTNEAIESLQNDAEVVNLGGLSQILEQLKHMNLLLENNRANKDSVTPNTQDNYHPQRLNASPEVTMVKKELIGLIERTKHPDIWEFLIQVEEVEKKSDLIWVINKMMQQVNIQVDRELKEQYQQIFKKALKIKG